MKRKTYIKILVITLVVLGGSMLFSQSKALAATWCGVLAPAPSGNCLLGQNYGTCTLEAGTCNGSLPEATLKSSFINNLQNYQNFGQPFEKVGANWIIARLGANWQNNLMAPSVTLAIQNFSYGLNTAYDPGTNSIVQYADANTNLSVVIYSGGVEVFAVKLNCGNPVGVLNPIPSANVTISGLVYARPSGSIGLAGVPVAIGVPKPGGVCDTSGSIPTITNGVTGGNDQDPAGGGYSVTIGGGTSFCIAVGATFTAPDGTKYSNPIITPANLSGVAGNCNGDTTNYWGLYSGNPNNSGAPFGCDYGTTQYNFEYSTITPPKPTISGYLYAYNGITEQPIANTYIYTCAKGWVKTNAAGQYSFTLNPGSGFCLRLVKNNTSKTTYIPAGETVSLSPNSNGPPPAPSPKCVIGGVANTTSYEYQVAAFGGSPGLCNYGLGNDSGYNIAVHVTASLTCNVSATPSIIDLNGTSKIVTGVNQTLNKWWFGSTINNVTGKLSGPATLTFSMSPTAPPPGYAFGYFYNTPPMTVAGAYDISSTVTGQPNVTSYTCTNPSGLIVAYSPYLKVYGGDVFSGVDSTKVGLCANGTTSDGIYSWLSPTNYGAGTSTAALSTGTLTQFVTGQGILAGGDPLTFANDPSSSSGKFGNGCTTPVSGDYYTQAVNSTTATVDQDLSTGYGSALPTAICPTGGTYNIPANQRIIYYYNNPVSPNLTINCNIYYSSGLSPASIPSFEVVVKNGNINIAPGVHNLAGTYIAEGGTINDNNGSVDVCPSGTVDDVNNDSCSNDQLTIDGSFIANQLLLNRTYGDTHAATTDTEGSTHAAEEFDYSPLNWAIPSPTTNTHNIQSITSLPPIVGN